MHQFLILGGDPRQLYLTRRLKKAGQKTLLYYDNSTPAFSLRDAMETSDIILCPVPFSKDGGAGDRHLSEPFNERPYPVWRQYSAFRKGALRVPEDSLP